MPNDLCSRFKLSSARIRQIARRHAASETFELFIEDGTQRAAISHVVTSRGFHFACRMAIRKYSGFFSNLELPNWRLIAGKHSVKLNAPELGADQNH